jgi:hypothetical protein
MSTTTYLGLCQQTQRACAISGALVTSVDNQVGILEKLTTWVADADVAVQREAVDWDFFYNDSYTTPVLQSVVDYVRPSDFGTWDTRTFVLDYGTDDYIELTKVPYRTYYNTLAIGSQTEAPPSNFILRPNNNVVLYPTPDKAYTLKANYWITPKRMVNNGDVSLIPEAFIRVIIARAKMYYAIDQESDPVYAEAQKEYTEVLSELKSDQLPGWKEYRASDGVDIVIGTDGYTGDGETSLIGDDFNTGFG